MTAGRQHLLRDLGVGDVGHAGVDDVDAVAQELGGGARDVRDAVLRGPRSRCVLADVGDHGHLDLRQHGERVEVELGHAAGADDADAQRARPHAHPTTGGTMGHWRSASLRG